MVEESEKTIHDVMLENTTKIKLVQLEENAKSQVCFTPVLYYNMMKPGCSLVLNMPQSGSGCAAKNKISVLPLDVNERSVLRLLFLLLQARLREQQQMKGKSVILNFKQLEHGNKNAAYNAKLGEMKGKILGYYSFCRQKYT